MKKYEIWAKFEDGIEVMIETHKTAENAKNAVDAMNRRNANDIAAGYGFPHGVPTYSIK